MRLTWAQPEDLLPHELVQSAAEGRDQAVLDAVAKRWWEAGGDIDAPVSGAGPRPATTTQRTLARELLATLDGLGTPDDPRHPTDFSDILAAADAPALASMDADASVLAGRIEGAWLGRSAGCLLGKPVEKIPRAGIEEIARSTGRWPLASYFTAVGLPDDVAQRWPWNRRSAPTSLEENISGMPEDDDLNYPLLALTLLEDSGRDFTTDDVAELWLANLPAGRVFTAERAAYRNILDARPVPETATYLNPFREWIGALIRADVFGWVNPGNPREAARLAWVDARLSHTRNGVYGAMWSAALASEAVTVRLDGGLPAAIDAVLAAGLSVVPADSALAEAVRFGANLGRSGESDVQALDALHARYGHLHWVHVLNNAATIAYALTAGGGDFGRSICLAVSAGWDTDSAGATVGAVVGALLGARGVPAQWAAPIDGRVATSLPGPAEHRIGDLTSRTLNLIEPEGLA
jgi:ADP-ribosylglycohydrolase